VSWDADVAVVGAGFAGLAAASQIKAAGSSVAVLEASGRVGGRTDTVSRGHLWLEAGGQWTGPGQKRVRELAERFGVEMFETPTEGVDLQMVDGSPTTLQNDAPYAPVVQQLDRLAAAIPTHAPWLAADADALDQMTIAEWLDRNIDDPTTRRSGRQVLEGLMTTPATQMSVLTVLHAACTSGTLAAALGIDGGAQEQRLLGGLHRLAALMAADLGPAVRLSAPVNGVRDSGEGVVVSYEGGEVRSARCVVAVPPSGWRHIIFDPGLPTANEALASSMPLGSVIKLQLVYERPFWRDAGFSGLVIDPSGLFTFMADNSSPDRHEGVLVTFLSAESADRWGDRALGPDASGLRRTALVEHVTAALGRGGPDVIDYIDRDWRAVRWVGGGYSGVMRPGGWGRVGAALRDPVGRIHWASAESAHEWNGYVEGALDAGSRAANEVLAQL
jgi:monoamine oxidase